MKALSEKTQDCFSLPNIPHSLRGYEFPNKNTLDLLGSFIIYYYYTGVVKTRKVDSIPFASKSEQFITKLFVQPIPSHPQVMCVKIQYPNDDFKKLVREKRPCNIPSLSANSINLLQVPIYRSTQFGVWHQDAAALLQLIPSNRIEEDREKVFHV